MNNKKRLLAIILSIIMAFGVFGMSACRRDREEEEEENGPIIELPEIENPDAGTAQLLRAIQIANYTIWKYTCYDAWINYGRIDPHNRFNVNTGTTVYGSLNAFEYTQIIEMILTAMKAINIIRNLPDANPQWNEIFNFYEDLLFGGFDSLEYYMGWGVWTSTTRINHRWERVVGVPRRSTRNADNNHVGGTLTVYDDQMWLIRALLEAYMMLEGHDGEYTQARRQWYLDYAVYLTFFTLDGYDHSWTSDGSRQWGGVWWGPSYSTKHTCSNAPFISPLVWLHEIFSQTGRDIRINTLLEQHGVFSNELDAYVWPGRKPGAGEIADLLYSSENIYASEFFLNYALRIYDYTMSAFRRPDGVFGDMLHAPAGSVTDSAAHGGLRTKTTVGGLVQIAHTYNTGAVISGAVDLYRVLSDVRFFEEAVDITNASFSYFANPNHKEGFYQFPQGVSGKADFDSILLRSWVELVLYDIYGYAQRFIDEFSRTLNFAYDNFFRDGFLPVDHLHGWNPALTSIGGNTHMQVADDVRIASIRTFNYSAQFSWIALSYFARDGVIQDFSRFK